MSNRDTLTTSSPGRKSHTPSSQGESSKLSGRQSRTPSTEKNSATSDRKSRKSSGRKSHRASGRSRVIYKKIIIRATATSAGKSRRSPSRKSRTPTEPDEQDESPPRDRSSSSSPSMSPERAERISKSRMCNLIFPVARAKSMMKVHNHGLRVSDKTAVFTAAVLEYLTTEILELSADAARDENRITIKPNHVNRAIKTDQELFGNFKNSTVPRSKFFPFGRMIRTTSTAHGPAQDETVSLPGPSTAPAASPSESGKSDAPGRGRREG